MPRAADDKGFRGEFIMGKYKSDFLQILDERGFIHQISDPEGLDKKCASGPITAYVGYDATATSLHIGNLISASMLYWLQQSGHKPIALMGGGTSMVGDPSFKDEQRALLSEEKIAGNINGIKKIFAKILKFGEGKTDAIMVNNADWLLKLNYVEFLRDVGRHFSVNRMLSFDSVRLRLEREQSLSFLEFNYMIMQGYDFVELNRRYGCILQMGGSDQWGNIINGVDLGHKMRIEQLYALTTPLLTTASGAKMGKTASGAVWLNEDLFSPYEFWQYFRNSEDDDVERFLKIFTRLPLSEIKHIMSDDINEAKKILATNVTAIVHGQEKAEQAAKTAKAVFEEGAIDLSLPSTIISKKQLNEGIGLLSALVMAGLAGSNGEARRHVKSGAVKINDKQINDERAILSEKDLLPQNIIKLSIGKKRHALLKLES